MRRRRDQLEVDAAQGVGEVEFDRRGGSGGRASGASRLVGMAMSLRMREQGMERARAATTRSSRSAAAARERDSRLERAGLAGLMADWVAREGGDDGRWGPGTGRTGGLDLTRAAKGDLSPGTSSCK